MTPDPFNSRDMALVKLFTKAFVELYNTAPCAGRSPTMELILMIWPLFLMTHLWYECPGQLHQNGYVQVDHISCTLPWKLFEITIPTGSGIVDKHIQAGIFLFDLADQNISSSFIGQIDNEMIDFSTPGSDLFCDRLKFIPAARCQKDMVSFSSQNNSELTPDPG